MKGYLISDPNQLPSFRKTRLHVALANIESNLRLDGRLFDKKLTLAELAIFETHFWLAALFGEQLFRKFPKILQTVELVRKQPQLDGFMKGFMAELEKNLHSEVQKLTELARLAFPGEKKMGKSLEDIANRRHSVLTAYYSHLSS